MPDECLLLQTKLNVVSVASLLLLPFLLQMMMIKLIWPTISIFALGARKLRVKFHAQTILSRFPIEYFLLCPNQLPVSLIKFFIFPVFKIIKLFMSFFK